MGRRVSLRRARSLPKLNMKIDLSRASSRVTVVLVTIMVLSYSALAVDQGKTLLLSPSVTNVEIGQEFDLFIAIDTGLVEIYAYQVFLAIEPPLARIDTVTQTAGWLAGILFNDGQCTTSLILNTFSANSCCPPSVNNSSSSRLCPASRVRESTASIKPAILLPPVSHYISGMKILSANCCFA